MIVARNKTIGCTRRITRISKFGAITVVFFLVFSFLVRLLLPFGDEPDFSVRAIGLVQGVHHWWSPYYWCTPLLDKIDVSSSVIFNVGHMSLWAYIAPFSFKESPGQILSRFAIGVFVASPLLIILIFRNLFAQVIETIGGVISFADFEKRLNSLGLSLVIPGMTYYLGVLSREQFTLVLSLLMFLFWRSRVVVTCLLVLIAMSDLGNSVVVFTFIFFVGLFSLAARLFGLKASLFLMILTIVFAYFAKGALLLLVSNIPFLASKALAILEKNSSNNFFQKYPLVLRPIITFMTASFMTPSGIKVIPIYLAFGAGLVTSVCKVVLKYTYMFHQSDLQSKLFISFQREIILSSSALVTVLFFVFMFPDYANAKYYIFLIPFFMTMILSVYPKYKVMKYVVACAILVPLNLVLFMF